MMAQRTGPAHSPTRKVLLNQGPWGKVPEAGEEWCDSGLGSLGDGQLWSLHQEEEEEEVEKEKVSGPQQCSTRGPSDQTHPGSCKPESEERLDSALGDSLQEDVATGLSQEVGALCLQEDAQPWLQNVLAFVTEDGDTALHLAVIHEHEEFLGSLLCFIENTEFLDLQNDLGQTALHIAVIIGLPTFIKKLLLAGADPCIQEKNGNTALHVACKEGQYPCAQTLLYSTDLNACAQNIHKIKKQLDSTNYDSYTALHIAIIRKDLQMIKFLLASGANVNKQELSCGRSPLHLAVESQVPEVVECLLNAGADTGARMYAGYTPIYSASYRPEQKILQMLRDFGSEEPDWESDDSLDMGSDEEYDDIVINTVPCDH
ncbi:NF-kappa-B inhibitor beta [Microcaecilia unicolor]|uniref:NF-kappa-B inhibitor alpha n=1 Tax=Microcaecilia unicolor TaxID=1415580 RepID=A0A6P7ZCW3_9AMPH|nr:NF-kappa-B inhibitor beta [Microcaecilia unicolor]